jgi:hypothetical protein
MSFVALTANEITHTWAPLYGVTVTQCHMWT